MTEVTKTRAADPTAAAKKAAAKVRKCAAELTEALRGAEDAGLVVDLAIHKSEDEVVEPGAPVVVGYVGTVEVCSVRIVAIAL
jgi:hypothetical protein